MIEMKVGNAAGPQIAYVQDAYEPPGFKRIVADLTERDWDVTDSEARLKAAIEELGTIDERNRLAAMWFIDKERNAAALLVFRPSLFQGATSAA